MYNKKQPPQNGDLQQRDQDDDHRCEQRVVDLRAKKHGKMRRKKRISRHPNCGLVRTETAMLDDSLKLEATARVVKHIIVPNSRIKPCESHCRVREITKQGQLRLALKTARAEMRPGPLGLQNRYSSSRWLPNLRNSTEPEFQTGQSKRENPVKCWFVYVP
jgi:hypothetical protein